MTQTPPYHGNRPADREVTQTFPFAADAEVASTRRRDRGVTAWRLRPFAERVAVVKRIAELFTERATDLPR